MKHLAALLLILTSCYAHAQSLPAPNVNLVSLDGQTHNLYSVLEEGKIVIIAFFSTQSTGSLAYHNSHSLTYLYNSHGPQGDNKVEIFYVEGDPATPKECITGNCSGSNNLNWTSGISFPIINDAALAQEFGVSDFPSLFIVCPDKQMTHVQPLSSNSLWEKAQNCPVGYGVYNAGIFDFSPGTLYREVCDALNLTPAFRLTNLGNAPLTSANIEVKWNNDVINTVNWTGNLQKFEYADIMAGNLAVLNGGQLKVTVTPPDPDQDPGNNSITTQFHTAQKFTDDVLQVKIRTDEFGYEVYWEMRDEFENMIAFGGNTYVGPNGGGVIIPPTLQSPGSYSGNTTIQKDIPVPHNGCFSFLIVDAFGDGLTCSNCSGIPNTSSGYYKIFNKYDPLTPLISGFSYGSYDRHYFRVSSPLLSATENDRSLSGDIVLFPNPASDILNITFYANKSQQARLDVYNELGKLIYSIAESEIQEGDNQWSVPVSNWVNGTYNLIITGENSQIAKRFVQIH